MKHKRLLVFVLFNLLGICIFGIGVSFILFGLLVLEHKDLDYTNSRPPHKLPTLEENAKLSMIDFKREPWFPYNKNRAPNTSPPDADFSQIDIPAMIPGVLVVSFVVQGVLCSGLAALGVVSSWIKCRLQRNIPSLVAYLVLWAAVMAAVLAAHFLEDEWLQDSLTSSLQSYSGLYDDSRDGVTWTAMMFGLKCCGVNGAGDFRDLGSWPPGDTGGQAFSTPLACCSKSTHPLHATEIPEYEEGCYLQGNATSENNNMNTGCLQPLRHLLPRHFTAPDYPVALCVLVVLHLVTVCITLKGAFKKKRHNDFWRRYLAAKAKSTTEDYVLTKEELTKLYAGALINVNNPRDLDRLGLIKGPDGSLRVRSSIGTNINATPEPKAPFRPSMSVIMDFDESDDVDFARGSAPVSRQTSRRTSPNTSPTQSVASMAGALSRFMGWSTAVPTAESGTDMSVHQLTTKSSLAPKASLAPSVSSKATSVVDVESKASSVDDGGVIGEDISRWQLAKGRLSSLKVPSLGRSSKAKGSIASKQSTSSKK